MATAITQTKPAYEHKDVHELVTNTIIEQLEKGVIPWQKPFKDAAYTPFNIPFNFTTGNRYRGINIVLLWSSAIKHGFQTDEWASFKQWQSKNERIRKGEKGNMVVYYDTFEKDVEGELKKIPFLKASYVFNRSQLESYTPPEPAVEKTGRLHPSINHILEIEQFIGNTGAEIEEMNSSAYYDITLDKIFLPNSANFTETERYSATENYLSTLFHELTHWTGAEKRLNRLEKARFGDRKYANEELVAEFGAAFLCSGFGLRTVEKGNHASYIDTWLKVLREDNRAIFRASSEASKAVDYLQSLQPE